MSDLGDLNLFLRVLDLGSISAAARSLDLSVAVASQRLIRLERGLGVRLLHRTTRQLRPTPEGIALAEQGRPLVEELDVLTSSLRNDAKSIAGTLRVTIPASSGRQYVSPLLPEFMARHPRLRLHIDLSDQMRDLVSDGLDLAIRIGTLKDSELVATRLASNRRVLCASPAYLRRHGTPKQPEDLARHECLLMAVSRDAADVWRLRGADGKDIDVRVQSRLKSNLGEVIRDAALGGMGIALHSTWHVCEDLRAGRLKLVLPDYQLPESGIYAVMPQRRMVLPRVRAFVEFLNRQLGETPPWERYLAAKPSKR
ncbi:MAG: LysR family transcriptional regulator [Pseudomonadota bacterium]|nr:LysR family transcriptional regulator [Pseudomonadota bacterium]